MDIIKIYIVLSSSVTFLFADLPYENWTSSTENANVSTSYLRTTKNLLPSSSKETEKGNDENEITNSEVSGPESTTREGEISSGNMEEDTKEITIISLEPTTNQGKLTTWKEDTTTVDSGTAGEEVPSTIYKKINLSESPINEQTTSGYNIPKSIPTLDVSIIDNRSELHIGMKAIVRVILTSPTGNFDDVGISLSQTQNEENFDIDIKSCNVGRSIMNERSYFNVVSRILQNTGFSKILHYGYHWMAAYVFPSDNEAHRQFSCDFYVFFHNAEGLADRQQIKTNYQSLIVLGPNTTNLFGEVVFTVRTSLLPMNKTGFYTMDPGTPSNISSKIKSVTKMVFKAWIPFYNPQILVRLDGRNIEALYLRVWKIGKNFYSGAELHVLKTCRATYSNATIQFPPHWVNRGYYDNENTTDDDVIVFEARVALSETAIIGTVSNISISIFIDDIQVWTSTVSIVALASNPDVPIEVYIKSNSSHELSPSEYVTFILEISIPGGRAETLNMTIITKEISEERDTPFLIENVGLSSVDKNLVCIQFDKYFQSESKEQPSAADTAYLNIAYINGDNASALMIQFDVRLNHERVKFDDSYVVAVYAGSTTTEKSINLNRPEIFHDDNKSALSNLRQMLDGNDTCLRLPLKGERPPVLLMKILTSWLGIETKEFEVKIKGDGMSCASHEKQNLLVSFPTSDIKESFHGFFKICVLINRMKIEEENLTQCTYRCDCKSEVQCKELILFMTNEEETGNWELCQLRAKNL